MTTKDEPKVTIRIEGKILGPDLQTWSPYYYYYYYYYCYCYYYYCYCYYYY